MAIKQDARDGAEDSFTWKNDRRNLSGQALTGLIMRTCSAYGTVVRVTIHVAHAHLSVRAFALVDMAEIDEAERVAAAFNRPRLGTAVVLLLEP